LEAFDGERSDEFGYDVAVSGDRIVVGAYFDNNDTGSAYIYALDGTLVRKIVAFDGEAQDEFGYSVAVSEDEALVLSKFESECCCRCFALP